MPQIDWNRELRDQMEFAWNAQFLPRLEGLTDAEYLWEPVDGSWSIRPDAAGHWRLERTSTEPAPPPVTTIAWRMMHIADVLGRRASRHFGDWSFDLDAISLPTTAAGGVALLAEQHERWISGLTAVGEEGLSRPCGQAERLYPDSPLAALVLHVNREFLHHAAEIQLLRDLYLRLGPQSSENGG
ncbi:MAG: DinB family protein [Thermomicrobiales bacterium]